MMAGLSARRVFIRKSPIAKGEPRSVENGPFRESAEGRFSPADAICHGEGVFLARRTCLATPETRCLSENRALPAAARDFSAAPEICRRPGLIFGGISSASASGTAATEEWSLPLASNRVPSGFFGSRRWWHVFPVPPASAASGTTRRWPRDRVAAVVEHAGRRIRGSFRCQLCFFTRSRRFRRCALSHLHEERELPAAEADFPAEKSVRRWQETFFVPRTCLAGGRSSSFYEGEVWRLAKELRNPEQGSCRSKGALKFRRSPFARRQRSSRNFRRVSAAENRARRCGEAMWRGLMPFELAGTSRGTRHELFPSVGTSRGT